MKKLIVNPNGIQEVDLTAEEIAQKEQEAIQEQAEQQARQTEVNQKAIDKANGNQKLLDLGLTQAEATALTGYTPPVAE